MGTTADKLEYLRITKSEIRTAIEGKGVTVPVNTPFRDYAAKISQIVAGDITAPTILSATVENANPNKLVVVFSEVVNITDVTGLTITGAATPTLSAPTGSGSNTITFTLSTALTNGQSVTLNAASSNTIKDAANNALAATTKAITNNVAAATTTYETETTTYMNALGIPNDSATSIYGITNSALWTKVNDLVVKLKTDGLFTLMGRVYLKLGNTAAQQATNLINTTLNGTFFGGWVFNATGAVSNGTTTYFDSGANFVNDYPAAANCGFTQVVNVIQSGPEANQCFIGGRSASNAQMMLYLATPTSINNLIVYSRTLIVSGATVGAGSGIHTVLIAGSNGEHYKNGALKHTAVNTSGSTPTSNIFEGAGNLPGAFAYSKGTIGSSAYHAGLTAAQVTNLYNSLNTFEIAIGRKQYV